MTMKIADYIPASAIEQAMAEYTFHIKRHNGEEAAMRQAIGLALSAWPGLAFKHSWTHIGHKKNVYVQVPIIEDGEPVV